MQFFEERNLPEVATGLKEDLKSNRRHMNDGILKAVRKAVVTSDKLLMAQKSTNERNRTKGKAVELMPQQESESIMEKLMAKMVNRPTLLQQEKEKALNKQIEKVFELDSF